MSISTQELSGFVNSVIKKWRELNSLEGKNKFAEYLEQARAERNFTATMIGQKGERFVQDLLEARKCQVVLSPGSRSPGDVFAFREVTPAGTSKPIPHLAIIQVKTTLYAASPEELTYGEKTDLDGFRQLVFDEFSKFKAFSQYLADYLVVSAGYAGVKLTAQNDDLDDLQPSLTSAHLIEVTSGKEIVKPFEQELRLLKFHKLS